MLIRNNLLLIRENFQLVQMVSVLRRQIMALCEYTFKEGLMNIS